MSVSIASELYLGIDGGGTKTSAWLGRLNADGELEVAGRGAAGSGNPRAIGFESSLENVSLAIRAAFQAAGLPSQSVGSACISLAGIGRPEEQDQIREWAAHQQIADRVRIATDAEIVIAATENPASKATHLTVSLIAGTGSIAWGKSRSGQIERCGGWGYLLGDEGSGYDLGLQAIRLACQTADGRRHDPELLAEILKATKCADSQQLIPWTYGASSSRENIASLAPIVFELAKQYASVQQIVNHAIAQLAELVLGVTRKFEPGPYSLLLAGGVLCQQPDYVRLLQAELDRLGQVPVQVHLVPHPVLGAIRLAAQLGN